GPATTSSPTSSASAAPAPPAPRHKPPHPSAPGLHRPSGPRSAPTTEVPCAVSVVRKGPFTYIRVHVKAPTRTYRERPVRDRGRLRAGVCACGAALVVRVL